MAWYCPRCGQAADQAGACDRDGIALVEVSQHELIGRMLGNYRLVERIGGGSFGQVYRAIHPRSGLVVAIKLLEFTMDHPDSPRVLTEARVAASLQHPNVVKALDLELTSDRRPFIVMEHLSGTTLREKLGAPMPIREAVAIASDILRGLAAAHRAGIVHRDLKPENVFSVAPDAAASLPKHDRVVIVDFGLAKLIANPTTPNLTVTGESIGTPRYMAPEQIRTKPVDGRADLYAVGVILFEAIAGRPPFAEDSTFQLFEAHVNRKPPSLRELRRDVPPALSDAVAKALEKDPDARFPDADTMRRALAAALKQRTSRMPLVAAGLATIALVAVTAFLVTRHSDPAPLPPPPPAAAAHDAAAVELTPEMLKGLDNLQKNLFAVTPHQIETMLCGTEQGLAAIADRHEPQIEVYREYYTRLRALLRKRAPTVDCKVP